MVEFKDLLKKYKNKVRDKKVDNPLQTLYEKHPSFSFNNFYNQVKMHLPHITYQDTLKFYGRLESSQQHKLRGERSKISQEGGIKFIPIVAKPHTYQLDLMDMQTFAGGPENNDGANYILVCVNILTRKLYAYTLKSKKKDEVFLKYKEFLRDSRFDANNITTDNGDEFNAVKSYNDSTNRKHFLAEPYDHTHMGKVERMNRTLKGTINKILEKTPDQHRWIEAFHEAVKLYNNDMLNRSILNKAPNDLDEGDKMKIVLKEEKEAKAGIKKSNEFKAGDTVRVHELLPDRNYMMKEKPTWSKETYVVQDRGPNNFGFQLRKPDGTLLPRKKVKVVNGQKVKGQYDDIKNTETRLQYYNLLKVAAPKKLIKNVKAPSQESLLKLSKGVAEKRKKVEANPKNVGYIKKRGREAIAAEKEAKKNPFVAPVATPPVAPKPAAALRATRSQTRSIEQSNALQSDYERNVIAAGQKEGRAARAARRG